MNSKWSFALALCLVVVCLLGGVTQTFACPKGYSGSGAFCVPNDNPDVTLNNPERHKPVKKLGVHPTGTFPTARARQLRGDVQPPVHKRGPGLFGCLFCSLFRRAQQLPIASCKLALNRPLLRSV